MFSPLSKTSFLTIIVAFCSIDNIILGSFIQSSNPDFFDFGNVYNFDQQSLNSYVYTPINIAHVFYRSSFREPYLTCVTRTGCLKFSKKES